MKRKLMRMFDLAIKSGGKVGLSKPLTQVGAAFWGKEVAAPMSLKEAEALVASVWPDNGKTCVMHNTIAPQPKFDLQIIIPVYNVEKYVRECLDSVAQQETKYKVQVVVIEDGATDSSAQIVDEYRYKPGFKIIHQQNKGFSGARNTGLTYIDARYVMFVDSDDILLPDAIEVMMDNAVRMGCDLLVGNYVTLRAGIRKPSGRKMSLCEAISGEQIHGFPWAKIYKAEMFRNVGFPENYWYEDTVQKIVLNRMCKKISTIPNAVYCYRRNPTGISARSRGLGRTLDSFHITRSLLRDREALGIKEDRETLAHMLLTQFRINCTRIHTQGNLRLDKAIFLLSGQILKDALGEDYVPRSLFHKAFSDGDFWTYLRCCLLNQM